MQDFIMVGANIAVALAGLIVGIYFAVKVFTLSDTVDRSTRDLFIAISIGAIFGSLHRIHALPVYISRVTGDEDAVGLLYHLSHWAVIAVLVFCAYGYILHMKPVFYWVSRTRWAIISALIIALMVILGTLAALVISKLA